MKQDWDILDFWFGPLKGPLDFPYARADKWFSKDAEFDRQIKEQFESLLRPASEGQLDHWKTSPRGTLSLLILMDQFPRNIYRGSAMAFAFDSLAQKLCCNGLAQDFDQELLPVERVFFYMPLEHAEDPGLQQASVARFTRLADQAPKDLWEVFDGFRDYAERHKKVIDQFGRFPHRNSVLGRNSTAEEAAFLATGQRF